MSNKTNIPDRFSRLLRIWVESQSDRFKWLETNSGINATSWKAAWHGKQKPSTDMLEAISNALPQHAFWLITGLDDSSYGHSAPLGCGFPSLSKKMTVSESYLSRECEYSLGAEKFLSENYQKEEIEGDKPLQVLEKIDQLKRYVRSSDYSVDGRKQLFISTEEEENHQANRSLRFMEIIIENCYLIDDNKLRKDLVELVIQQVSADKKGSEGKFEILEQAQKRKKMEFLLAHVTSTYENKNGNS